MECTAAVSLFDLAGRKVRSLLSGARSTPGQHGIRWDGRDNRDNRGDRTGAGAYLVQIHAGAEVRVAKLVVLP